MQFFEEQTAAQLRYWDAATGEPLLPALPLVEASAGHSLGPWQAPFGRDGRRLLTSDSPTAVGAWDLPGAEGSAEDLARLAQALTGRRFHESGTLLALDNDAWQAVRREAAALFKGPAGL
jgi:hypothetical protein